MGYTTLLFDLDHTLLDSDESERLAYAHTAELFGVADPDEHFGRYVGINRAMWRAVELGDARPGEVRHRRFEQFNREIGLDADPHAMADAFVDGLASLGELYDGVHELLSALAAEASLAMVTNGLSQVQRTRIDRLAIGEYFDTVVISEEVGVTKPRPEIFELAFDALGRPDPDTALMIGDSLTSDIAGGSGYGIDTCWYNPGRAAPPAAPAATHEVERLAELPAVVDLGRPADGRTAPYPARP